MNIKNLFSDSNSHGQLLTYPLPIKSHIFVGFHRILKLMACVLLTDTDSFYKLAQTTFLSLSVLIGDILSLFSIPWPKTETRESRKQSYRRKEAVGDWQCRSDGVSVHLNSPPPSLPTTPPPLPNRKPPAVIYNDVSPRCMVMQSWSFVLCEGLADWPRQKNSCNDPNARDTPCLVERRILVHYNRAIFTQEVQNIKIMY